jgi:hypothetical protein
MSTAMEGNMVDMTEMLSRGGKPILVETKRYWFRVFGLEQEVTEELIRSIVEPIASPKYVLIAHDTDDTSSMQWAWIEMHIESDMNKARQSLTDKGYRTLDP